MIKNITKGVDITNHYLDTSQKQYRLFRYQNNVYAVKYDGNNRPVDYVHMWNSHKMDSNKPPKKPYATEHKKLGSGVEGKVYAKTSDKAVKTFKQSTSIGLQKSQDTNIRLLDQKFLLHDNNIDKHFVLGLYNNKRGEPDIVYVMPKIIKDNHKDTDLELNTLVHVLKKMNGLGLAHQDYCTGPFIINFNNDVSTKEGIKLVDMDAGLHDFSKDNIAGMKTDQEKVFSAFYRDQWLLVYNLKLDERGEWRQTIETEWYDKNPGKALTDNPEALLSFINQKTISLPDDMVKDLKAKVTPLMLAIQEDNLPAIITALNNPALKKEEWLSALTFAAAHGNSEVIEAFIHSSKESKSEPGQGRREEKQYNIPLIIAMAKGHVDIVDQFITAGAALNLDGEDSRAALHWLAKRNDVDALHSLLVQHPYILFSAIEKKDVTLIKAFLHSNADLTITDNEGNSALSIMAERLDDVAFQEVLHSMDDNQAAQALVHSMKQDDLNSFRRLIKVDGVDSFLNHVDEKNNDETPLMIAAKQPDGDRYIKLLLESGADYTLKNKEGKSAVDMAIDPKKFISRVAQVEKQNCSDVLKRMQDCRFGQDNEMDTFMADKITLIKNARSIEELCEIKSDLNATYEQLQPVTNAVNKVITDLSSKMGSGTSEKSTEIQRLMRLVPVEERYTIGADNETEAASKVSKEMARPRELFGSGKVPLIDGHIDLDKAAQTFKDFKKIYKTYINTVTVHVDSGLEEKQAPQGMGHK